MDNNTREHQAGSVVFIHCGKEFEVKESEVNNLAMRCTECGSLLSGIKQEPFGGLTVVSIK